MTENIGITFYFKLSKNSFKNLGATELDKRLGDNIIGKPGRQGYYPPNLHCEASWVNRKYHITIKKDALIVDVHYHAASKNEIEFNIVDIYRGAKGLIELIEKD